MKKKTSFHIIYFSFLCKPEEDVLDFTLEYKFIQKDGLSLVFLPSYIVDAPITDHIWQFCWYFSYLFEFIYQKDCFYAIYMLYYFTNLIIWNNIYENVSIQSQGSILKPKAPSPVHVFLLAYTMKWKIQIQNSFSIT